MRPEDAPRYIVERVRVTRSDIAAAKSFVLQRSGTDVMQWMNEWIAANHAELTLPVPMYGSDPRPELDRVVRYSTLRLALLEAVRELIAVGILWPSSGHMQEWGESIPWTTVAPGGSGSSSGWSMGELQVQGPTKVRRAIWSEPRSELSDGDLLVRSLDTADLHPGIAEALHQAVHCLRLELYLPAIAMLGAASEGAWTELGRSLAALFPGDKEVSQDLDKITGFNLGVAKKIDLVLKLFGKACSEKGLNGGRRQDLLRISQWSDLVRDGRNALHWDTDATIPNTYEKVATLLLGAASNIGLLYEVRATALAAARS